MSLLPQVAATDDQVPIQGHYRLLHGTEDARYRTCAEAYEKLKRPYADGPFWLAGAEGE